MSFWNEVKKGAKKVGGGIVRGATAVATGGISETGAGAALDKKFISGDYDARNKANKEKAEALKKQEAYAKTAMGKQEALDTGLDQSSQAQLSTYQGSRNGILDKMNGIDQTYGKSVSDYENQFQGQQSALMEQAAANGREADSVYQDLKPRQQSLMERAQQNASQAMSLQDAMDPNNKVASDTRALYEKQAQGEQKQGYQSYGVLSALGQQGAQNQMKGPMSVGQQAAMMANANRGASEAYANTQKRMQNLRDQGLEMGYNRSDMAYAQGQEAQDRASNSIKDTEGLNDRYTARSSALRGEQSGYGENVRGSKGRVADTTRNVDQGIQGRAMGATQEDYTMNTGLQKDIYGRASDRNTAGLKRNDGATDRQMASIQSRMDQINGDLARNQAGLNTGLNVGAKVAGAFAGSPTALTGGGGYQQPQAYDGQQTTYAQPYDYSGINNRMSRYA